MERMLARVQSPQWYSTPRSPNPKDQPSGSPPSGASDVVPHRQQTRLTEGSVDGEGVGTADPARCGNLTSG